MPTGTHYLHVEHDGGIVIATLPYSTVRDEEMALKIGQEITALDGAEVKLLINLRSVEEFSSRFLGMLAPLPRRMKAKLVFYVSEELASVFSSMKLDQTLKTTQNKEEALKLLRE